MASEAKKPVSGKPTYQAESRYFLLRPRDIPGAFAIVPFSHIGLASLQILPFFLPADFGQYNKGAQMDREYGIFEKVGENELWRCSVVGLRTAKLKLKELAAKSANGFMVMHMASNTVVAKLNTASQPR